MDIRRQPESQNQNDSNDEQPRSPLRRAVIKDTVKVDAGNTDKVAVKDAAKVAVKNAIVSSAFVRLRTIFGEQYLSDPSVERRRGGIRPIRRHRTF